MHELTPLLGGARGTTRAFVPALEARLAWKQRDACVEAECVRDGNAHTDSVVHAWRGPGLRPVEWLRVGVAGQFAERDAQVDSPRSREETR